MRIPRALADPLLELPDSARRYPYAKYTTFLLDSIPTPFAISKKLAVHFRRFVFIAGKANPERRFLYAGRAALARFAAGVFILS